MVDYGAAYTDKEIKILESHIKSIYGEAKKDLNAKLKDFNARFKVKDAKHKADLKAGKITNDEYQAWLKGQVFQGDHWKQMKAQMESVLLNANQEAINIVNGGKVSVIAHNANYMAYSLEHTAGVNLGFALYDRDTVTNLLKNQPDLLPNKHVDPVKDSAWNRKKITRQVTQGILQGESTQEVANRLASTLSSQNMNSMLTTARTSMTSAQNVGRQVRLEEAKEKGIKLKKEWMCTLDMHTRIAHRELDGQKVDVDKKFKWGDYEIAYPADPEAAPFLVYNCRCTMVADLNDYPEAYRRYDNIDGVAVDGMTYSEWAKAKGYVKDVGYTWKLGNGTIEILGKTYTEAEIMAYLGTPDEDVLYDILTNKYNSEDVDMLLDKNGNFDVQKLRMFLGWDKINIDIADDKIIEKIDKYVGKITAALQEKDAERFLELLNNCPDDNMKMLYKKYADEIKSLKYTKNGGVYKNGSKSIEFGLATKYDDMNDFGTLAHEYGHFFDVCVSGNGTLTYAEIDAVNAALRYEWASEGYKVIKDTKASWSDEFLSALRMDKKNLKSSLDPMSVNYYVMIDDIKSTNASSGLQDAFDGFFGTQSKYIFRWGHGDKYYNRNYNNYVKGRHKEKEVKTAYQNLGLDASSQAKCKDLMRDYETASEVWANMASAVVCNDDSLKYFEKYMPNTLASFRNIIRRVQ